MNLSTLKGTFRATFDPKQTETAARRLGAVERIRKVHPFDFVLALLTTVTVGPERSIAASRRSWQALTGDTITPDSFDDHFHPGMVRLFWELLTDGFATSNRALRRRWPAPLRALEDILIVDGTRMAVQAALAQVLRATTPGDAALKLMGVLSLGEGHLLDVRTGAAVHHDRKLLRLGPLVAGALYLLDLGFYDHDLFASYQDAQAFFVSRIKDQVVLTITAVYQGVVGAERAVGWRLTDPLTFYPEVDVDAALSVKDDPTTKVRIFRVVKIDLPCMDRHRKPTSETKAFWFVTNLPRDTWTPAMIAALYRLRWAIERIWRETKHLARLDHLKSARPAVIFIFVAASLLFHLLAERLICLLALRWGVERVSRDRVITSLLAKWHDLARDLHDTSEVGDGRLKELARLIMREGKHPNPSQPRCIDEVFRTIRSEAGLPERKVA